MSIYLFEKPLIRGTMLKRKSQFTALVDIDGEELIAHIPTTNRIGDVENKNLPCLLSYHDNPKRKLKYDIEAVLLSDDDNWVGINQILSNRMVKHLNELAGSLKDHEKAVFLQVYQYRITEKKKRLRSTHYEEVAQTFRDAAKAGVEFWELQMDFRPEGVSLFRLMRSTDL